MFNLFKYKKSTDELEINEIANRVLIKALFSSLHSNASETIEATKLINSNINKLFGYISEILTPSVMQCRSFLDIDFYNKYTPKKGIRITSQSKKRLISRKRNNII